MSWLIVLAVLVAVLVIAGRLAGGRWPVSGLPDPVRTIPATGLPATPRAADVDGVRFDTAFRGYHTAEVDRRLEVLRDRLGAAELAALPAAAGDDQGAQMSSTRVPADQEATDGETADGGAARSDGGGIRLAFRGYRTDQVDEVLDGLEAALNPACDPTEDSSVTGSSDVAARTDGYDASALRGVPAGAPRRGWPTWLTGDRRLPDRPRPPWRARPDLLAALVYAALAVYLLSGLIADPRGTYLSQGVQDQQLFEFYLGASAHNLATLSNPLFTYLQNYPFGVNLVANTGFLGLGLPLAPLTFFAGPHVSFIVVEWLGFFLTALLWYRLFAVWLTRHRGVAFIGGLLCGFSPGMVSHGNGHPNFLAQFLVPVIIDRLLELHRPGHTRSRVIRIGVVLGVCVAWQIFLGEEVLLLAAIGIGIIALVLIAHRALDVRTVLPGTLVGVATTLVLVGFPLWWQFLGPQSYRSLFQPPGNNDLASLWGRATRTFGADPWISAALSMNRTEENAFFGIALWLVAIAVIVLLWRRPLVRACALVIFLMSWVSLGTPVYLNGTVTSLPSLWSLAQQVPLVHLVVPTRFTLVAVPAFATLLVMGLEEVRVRCAPQVPAARRWARWTLPTAWATVVLALLPLAPTPLVADPRPKVPAFFTTGAWRDWVHGGSVLPVPTGDIVDMRSVDWQASARWAFPLPEGYFVGPDGHGTGGGQRGAVRLPFSQWMHEVLGSGQPLVATDEQRVQFRADLRTWRVDAVVLPADHEKAAALLESMESALGPARLLGEAYVWDVRALRGATQ